MYSMIVLIAIILSVFAYYNEAKIKRLGDTIKRLGEEKIWIENNAADIINLIGKEGYRMVISRNEKSFDTTVMLTDKQVNAYVKSEPLIPPKHKIEYMITQMKEFKKKGGKSVKANTKRQTDNKEK